MRNLCLLSFLLLSIDSFCQITDSIPKKTFENFFGCECCADTIVKAAGRKGLYECTLYKPDCILITRKNGRVSWIHDLKKDFETINVEHLCLDEISWRQSSRAFLVNNGEYPSKIIILRPGNGKKINK